MMSMPTLTDRAHEHRVSRAQFEAFREEREKRSDSARYELLDGELLMTPSPAARRPTSRARNAERSPHRWRSPSVRPTWCAEFSLAGGARGDHAAPHRPTEQDDDVAENEEHD